MDLAVVDVDSDMRRLPELHPLTELVERLWFVPEAVLVALAHAPADRDVLNLDARDGGGGFLVEQMKRDNVTEFVDKLTRVGGGNGPEFEDDALLAETNVIQELPPSLNNSVSHRGLFE